MKLLTTKSRWTLVLTLIISTALIEIGTFLIIDQLAINKVTILSIALQVIGFLIIGFILGRIKLKLSRYDLETALEMLTYEETIEAKTRVKFIVKKINFSKMSFSEKLQYVAYIAGCIIFIISSITTFFGITQPKILAINNAHTPFMNQIGGIAMFLIGSICFIMARFVGTKYENPLDDPNFDDRVNELIQRVENEIKRSGEEHHL